MGMTAKEMVESPDFKKLVSTRWKVSLTLLFLCCASYYGYILLVALNKPFMSQKIGQFTTMGIPIGIATILASFVLTLIYVVWANTKYDPEVKRLKEQITG